MTKPIGYYLNYLSQLEQKYGSCFEQITRREKFFLIFSLAANLIDTASGETRDEIYLLGREIAENLTDSEQEALVQTLISQIRGRNYARPVHHA